MKLTKEQVKNLKNEMSIVGKIIYSVGGIKIVSVEESLWNENTLRVVTKTRAFHPVWLVMLAVASVVFLVCRGVVGVIEFWEENRAYGGDVFEIKK